MDDRTKSTIIYTKGSFSFPRNEES